MSILEVCGNCRTLFKDDDDRLTTIVASSKNKEESAGLSFKTVSIYEALSIVFEIPPLIPNTISSESENDHEDEGNAHSQKMQMFFERSKFAKNLHTSEKLPQTEERRGYTMCTNCSKLLTELYNAMQNFTAVCKTESEIGKVLKEIREKAHRRPTLSPVTAEQARISKNLNQETDVVVKTEPLESESEDDDDSMNSFYKSNEALNTVNVPQFSGDNEESSDDMFNNGEPDSPDRDTPEFEGRSTNEVKAEMTLRPRRNIAKTRSTNYTHSDTDGTDSDEETENRAINNFNGNVRHAKRKKQNSDDEFIPEYQTVEITRPKPYLSPVSIQKTGNHKQKEILARHPLGSNQLTCPKCGINFLHESTYICHRRIVHREQIAIPYPERLPLSNSTKGTQADFNGSCDLRSTCPICREEVSRSEIRNHTSLHLRSLTKPWLCTICGKECTSQENLFEHSRFHKLSIPCKRCGKKVPRLEMLVHSRACLKVAATGNFSCKNCDETFKSSLQLMEHRSLVHNHVWKCKLCESKFSRRVKMVQHMLSHRKKKAFKCKICEKTFDRNDVLRLHVKRFHLNDAPPSVKKSSCLENGDDCDVGVISESELPDSDGKDNASDKDKYKCKACDLSFHTQTKVEAHMTVHTDADSFKCTICNRVFEDNYCLTLHMKNHYEKKPMLCCVCQKHYRDKNSLFYHLKDTHAFENQAIVNAYPGAFRSLAKNPFKTLPKRKKRILKRPPVRGEFPCETCGKVFPFLHSVTNHIKTVHDQIKDFICSYCGKAFAKKAYFILHEKLHTTTDTPYKCHLCGKGFRLPGNLRQHLKSTIHNPTRDYICEICGKGFNRSDNMKLHVKAVHMKIQIRKPRTHGESSSQGRRRIGNESHRISKREVSSLLEHASSSSQIVGGRFPESSAFNQSALKQENASSVNSSTGPYSENESTQQHDATNNMSTPGLYQENLAEQGHNQFDSQTHANFNIQPSPFGLSLRGFQYR